MEDTLGKDRNKTDGHTDVVNRTLSQLLRAMIKKNLRVTTVKLIGIVCSLPYQPRQQTILDDPQV